MMPELQGLFPGIDCQAFIGIEDEWGEEVADICVSCGLPEAAHIPGREERGEGLELTLPAPAAEDL